MIDKEGYGNNLWAGKGKPLQMAVPSKTDRKETFYFDLPHESVNVIRLFDLSFNI